MEIRRLVAPKLDQLTNLGTRLLCHRPWRQGGPRMSVEKKEMQLLADIGKSDGEQQKEGDGGRKGVPVVVAHNYGHGGSGWTMAPGAAKHVNEMLLKELQEKMQRNISAPSSSELIPPALDCKQVPVIVVGAGVIGLFTAYHLVKMGFQRVIIIAENSEQLASQYAGGLLAPIILEANGPIPSMASTSVDGETEMSDPLLVNIDSYHFYAKLARGELKEFSKGAARFTPLYSDDSHLGFDPYVSAGVMRPPQNVLVQFGTSARQWPMLVYEDGIFLDSILILEDLRKFLVANNVRFMQQKVMNFEELLPLLENNMPPKEMIAAAIVNCTGLGAAELCNDQRVYSVQGHLILLKGQDPAQLDYTLVHFIGEGRTKSGQLAIRQFYVFPKSWQRTEKNGQRKTEIGVFGGTFIANAEADTPNSEEFDILIENARKFLFDNED